MIVSEKIFERETKTAKLLQCGNHIVSYTKNGSDKKNIVLIHGWAQSKKTWKKVIPRLEKEFTVYAIDLPGFGMSSRLSHVISLEEYADVLFLFTKQLGLHKFIILGHSFGGKVSTVFANKYPKCIKKIILYSSGIGNLNKHVTLLSKILRLGLKLSSVSTLGLRFSFLLFDKTHKDTNFLQKILAIKQPILLIYGRYDILAPVYQGYFIKKQLGNSKLVIFNNSTHIAHKEESRRFVYELKNFIRDDN